MKTNVKTLSDLDLAKMLEDQFGTENLIKAPSGIWHFNGLTKSCGDHFTRRKSRQCNAQPPFGNA